MSKKQLQQPTKTGNRKRVADNGAPPTKSELIVKLLRSKRGASIEEMQKATSWQAHSIRGFISGTVKRRMGLSLGGERDKNGIRRYRIIEPDAVLADG